MEILICVTDTIRYDTIEEFRAYLCQK